MRKSPAGVGQWLQRRVQRGAAEQRENSGRALTSRTLGHKEKGAEIIGSAEALPGDEEEADEESPQEARDWAGAVRPEWAGGRLDRALVDLYPGYSRSHLQSLVDEGRVCLAGEACTQAARKLRLGQQMQVSWRPPQHEVPFEAEALPIDVRFEDEHLLVLNKPAGWVVHPAAGNWSGTLLNALLAHHEAARLLPRAGIVHRLDKDTSGLMVVAKTVAAYHALVAQLASREVGREYMALCHGRVAQAFSVEAPIGRDSRSRVRMAVTHDGKPARTDFTPLAQGQADTLLHCRLHTGRTHQIRVHAASRGLPLVGDELYGGRPMGGMQRQALHAARLRLHHPVQGQMMMWMSSPPEDFEAAARILVGWPGGGLAEGL